MEFAASLTSLVEAAVFDYQREHPAIEETGAGLEKRLALTARRVMPRAGDTKMYKRIYASIRFLLKTQNKQFVVD